MSDDTAAAPTAVAMGSGSVRVSVRTYRHAPPDGAVLCERQSSAQGELAVALDEALAERLAPWALQQVLAAILACDTADGHAVRYEGYFDRSHRIVVDVAPLVDGRPAARQPPLRVALDGLTVPAAARTARA